MIACLLLWTIANDASGFDDRPDSSSIASTRGPEPAAEKNEPTRLDVGQQAAQAIAGGQPGAPTSLQGLSKDDQAILFHMAEGSELIPLAWVRALKSIKTSRPFLELPQRFGLMPDPDNADGLPIGITAAPSRGAEVLGPMMGVNCAACHVGALSYRGKHFPLLGAPNMFDLNTFYQELFASLLVTIADDESQLEFMDRLEKQGDLDFTILTQQLATSAVGVSKMSPAQAKGAEHLFQLRLLEIVKKLTAQSQAKAASTPPTAASIMEFKKNLEQQVSSLFQKDVLGLVALIRSNNGLDKSVLDALKSDNLTLRDSIERFVVSMALFRARIRFLGDLKNLHARERPLPGPGRIDAFDGIRDLVFLKEDALAVNAPVSYPSLWILNQTYWLHWDGNTNTVIERNIGQALGQGAAFDREKFHSTVQTENLHVLEQTVRKMTPPEWPAPLFGPIDDAKAARGKILYNKTGCAECHVVTSRTGRAMFDALLTAQEWGRQPIKTRGPQPLLPEPLEKLIPAKKVGTDPMRALNFATNVAREVPDLTGGIDFAEAIGKAAFKYAQQSYRDQRIPESAKAAFDWPREMVYWQTTRSYAARPLVSIWASAPYLHNGSVPTLYHLLLPAKDRPKLFPVGHREFDPVKLGYTIDLKAIPVDQYPLLFEINTTMSGNSNAGHEYGTNLSDADRYDLLEYLKTL